MLEWKIQISHQYQCNLISLGFTMKKEKCRCSLNKEIEMEEIPLGSLCLFQQKVNTAHLTFCFAHTHTQDQLTDFFYGTDHSNTTTPQSSLITLHI